MSFIGCLKLPFFSPSQEGLSYTGAFHLKSLKLFEWDPLHTVCVPLIESKLDNV